MNREAHFVGPLDRLLYLKTLPTLQGSGTRELAVIARHAREEEFGQGEDLLAEDQSIERFHIVVSGRVRMSAAGQTLVSCGPGENVGLLHALAGADRTVRAMAEVDTLTLSFDIQVILDLFEENFAVLQHSIRTLADYQRGILEQTVGGSFRAPWGEEGNVPDRNLDIVERLVLMRRGDIFQNIGLEALARMATSMQQERWTPAARLWSVGEPADHMLLILQGTVRCELADGTVFRAGPGYPLGNLETLARTSRWYGVTCETPLTTLRGNHEALFDVIEDDFDVAIDFLAAMAKGTLRAITLLAERSDVTLEQKKILASPPVSS